MYVNIKTNIMYGFNLQHFSNIITHIIQNLKQKIIPKIFRITKYTLKTAENKDLQSGILT